MELRQLKYFVKTAETLNFSEAARQLFVTQSTLSQQIKTLEEELGADLFERDSHSVRLTEAGEHLLPSARLTLTNAESCRSQMNDLKNMLSGQLNIGITFSFAPILTETVKTFTRLYPDVKLKIVSRNMEVILDKLKRHEVDFVLCFRPLYDDAEIEAHSLFDDHLCAIMKHDHPLAGQSVISLDDLRGQRIAMPESNTQARSTFDRCFPGAASRLNIQMEVNSVNILLDVVQATHMITFLSESSLYNRGGGLKAIPLDSPHSQMIGCVHTLKKTYRKRAAEEFIRLLAQSDAISSRVNSWLK